MKTVAQCVTLREYRESVLGLPQTEVARRAKRHQAWISFIERGHLPLPWNRENLLKAYELDGETFERLVLGAIRVKAMKTPITESAPLLATGKMEGLTATLYTEAPIIGEEEQRRRQA